MDCGPDLKRISGLMGKMETTIIPRGYIYRDYGKENGSYYLGFYGLVLGVWGLVLRVWGFGFRA